MPVRHGRSHTVRVWLLSLALLMLLNEQLQVPYFIQMEKLGVFALLDTGHLSTRILCFPCDGTWTGECSRSLRTPYSLTRYRCPVLVN
jgi:hypothetical protein